jgi:hypothetical protein
MFQALGAAHGRPIVLIFGCAQQTDLVILSVSTASWPGELVGASPEHKNIHDFLRHEVTSGPWERRKPHHLPNRSSWEGYFRVGLRQRLGQLALLHEVRLWKESEIVIRKCSGMPLCIIALWEMPLPAT